MAKKAAQKTAEPKQETQDQEAPDQRPEGQIDEAQLPEDTEVAKLVQETLDLKDQLLRQAAENDNLRKRQAKELEDAHKYATTNFAKDMIEVADNFERCLQNITQTDDKTVKTILDGLDIIQKELFNSMHKHGIVKINPVAGEDKFDYNIHQAMMEVDDDDLASGIIKDVLKVGYKIHDRLLRPAMVVVSK